MTNSLVYGPDIVHYLVELRDRLEVTPHRERGVLIKSCAELFGITPKTVYARLNKLAGRKTERKRRSDAGNCKIDIGQLKEISRLKETTRRKNGKAMLGTKGALEIAHANGIINGEQMVCSARANQLLRKHHLDGKALNAPSPHTPMQSLHPNHVWQFDVSTCVIYYMEESFHIMDSTVFYKNKPDNVVRVEKQRVQRYLMTDHLSCAFFCRYYLTPGEDSKTLFDFFMEAFENKPGFLMHGVPSMLVWDAGSANQSYEIKNMLDGLGVEHIAHKPGNPRAKGQVESMHNVIEKGFESRLKFKDIDNLAQLNQHLDTWQIAYNSLENHSRHGHTRYGFWQTIRPEQLRLAPDPERCKMLLEGKPNVRTVAGDLTISLAIKGEGSRNYSVADVPDVYVTSKVLVTVNPFRAPNVWVRMADSDEESPRYECEPVEYGPAGFPVNAPVYGEGYVRQADTPIETERKARDLAAYGTADDRKARKKSNAGAPAYGGEIDSLNYLVNHLPPDFANRSGSEIHLPDRVSIDIKPLTITQALRQIHSRLGRTITAQENDFVNAQYPGGVPEEDIKEIVTRFTETPLTGTGGLAS